MFVDISTSMMAFATVFNELNDSRNYLQEKGLEKVKMVAVTKDFF